MARKRKFPTEDYYFKHGHVEGGPQYSHLLQPDEEIKGIVESHRLFTKYRQNPGFLTQLHEAVSWVVSEAQLSVEWLRTQWKECTRSATSTSVPPHPPMKRTLHFPPALTKEHL